MKDKKMLGQKDVGTEELGKKMLGQKDEMRDNE
jgi:hypothetical protein